MAWLSGLVWRCVVGLATQLLPVAVEQDAHHEAHAGARGAPKKDEAIIAQMLDQPTAQYGGEDDAAETEDLVCGEELTVFRTR
jgi:hypothetical protein